MTLPPGSLEEAWHEYYELVIPKADAAMYVRHRRAFYAGAIASLAILHELALGDCRKEEKFAAYRSLKEEAIRFQTAVSKGQA